MSAEERPFDLSRLEIRPFSPADSIAEITALLHRAYARLADMGLRYLATWQSEDVTRNRLDHGMPFVGVLDGRLIGTMTLYPEARSDSPAWYHRTDVVSVGQFAVDPEMQQRGIGTRMMEHAQETARRLGFLELALDTSDRAQHLIEWYRQLGWRIVGEVDYSITNYRSVVLSKTL